MIAFALLPAQVPGRPILLDLGTGHRPVKDRAAEWAGKVDPVASRPADPEPAAAIEDDGPWPDLCCLG